MECESVALYHHCVSLIWSVELVKAEATAIAVSNTTTALP